MGRMRVSKGKIIQNKDQKIIEILKMLPFDVTEDNFILKFQEVYPEDWENIQKRYDEHERVTQKGRSHPMAHPCQYLLNISRDLRKQHAKGTDLSQILNELNTTKPKFFEKTPSDLKKLLQQVEDLTSYKLRIAAINILGKYKCDESITALHNRLLNDPVYDVRKTAYLKLVRFEIEVGKPKKDATYDSSEINNKVGHVIAQLKQGFSYDYLTNKFKAMYPEEYDLQKYRLKNRFKHWLGNLVKNLPKT